MRELNWTEHEVVECLGVLPNVNEDSAIYEFQVNSGGLLLHLGICDYDSHVDIQLMRSSDNTLIFETAFFVLDKVTYVNEKQTSFLEFSECMIGSFNLDIDLGGNHGNLKLPKFQIHMFPKFELKFI